MRHFTRIVSLSIAPFMVPISPAIGQDDAANYRDSDQLQDIIVTAQKRETSLLDTPISISVLGSEALESRGISNFSDMIAGGIPSIRVAPFTGRSSAITIGMRGIVPVDATQISRDPAVGIYVDGIYLGRVQGLGTEMFEVERIEVLRGPQGTLFGRNAVGGAVNVISKKPTGDLGATISGGLRNYDGHNLRAALNLPEFAGVSVKVEGTYLKRDGWVSNPSGKGLGWHGYDRKGVRASALWRPVDGLSAFYSFDKSKDASTTGYGHITRLLDGSPPLPEIFSLEPERVSVGRAGVVVEPSVGKTTDHGLELNWQVGDRVALRSITAHRKMNQSVHDNAAGSFLSYYPNGYFGRTSTGFVDQKQFSQELQIIGDLDRLDYMVGAFYFRERANDLSHAVLTGRFNSDGTDYTALETPLPIGAFPDRASKAASNSKALFGQATYRPNILGDGLKITAGLRWTNDQKNGALTEKAGQPTTSTFTFRSSRIDPAITLAYDFDSGLHSYVRWGTAYRAGGANSRSATFRTFEAEVVESWEVGLKSQLFDRRAQISAAAYSSRYKNRQADFANPANPSDQETMNTSEVAKIKGVEVDFTAKLAPPLTVSLNYVFTDWYMPLTLDPFRNTLSQGTISYTPRHAASAALDYRLQRFSFGELGVHVDANYSSSFITGGDTVPKTDPYLMLNSRITLDEIALGNKQSKLAVSFWMKNMTNKAWETFIVPLEGRGLYSTHLSHYNEPRTYGVDLKVTF